MAKRPNLTDVSSGYQQASTLEANFNAIEQAFDNTVSRDGSTPNQMAADLDMNSNDILNVGDIGISGTLTINGSDINDLLTGLGAGEVYAVTNRYSGDGVTVDFSLTIEPVARANTSVFINGVYQQKNTYDVSGTTLTFTAAPPVGTDNVEIVTLGPVESGTVPASGVSSTVNGNVQADLDELYTVFDSRSTGTWTPVVADAESEGNEAVTSSSVGKYTRTESMVYVEFRITGIDVAGLTSGNNLYITGLPFTVSNDVTSNASSNVAEVTRFTFTTLPLITPAPNTKVMRLRQPVSDAASAFYNVSAVFNTSCSIAGRIWYRTSE